MKPSSRSSSSAAAVHLEEGAMAPNAGPPRKAPVVSLLWSRRIALLAAALLLVAVVNIFHLSEEILAREADQDEDHRGCVRLDATHLAPGFYREGTCFTRAQVLSIIKELVFTGAEAFDAHNVTYFLESGTLLGAFRDQQVIRHDNDADFGVDAVGFHYLQHHAIEFPPQYTFTVWNSSLYPDSDRDDKLPARLIHRDSGLYLDVFAFLDWTDEKTGAAEVGPIPSWCFHNCAGCPTVSGGKQLRVVRDWIFPVVNCAFEGRETLKCPRKTQQYLRYTFGRSYMTPVKYNHGKVPKERWWGGW